MPRALKLTWDRAGGRWKKIYRGRVFYFPAPRGKSDALGYKRAWEQFERRKAEIDADADKPHRAEYQRALVLRRDMLDWMRLEADALAEDAELREMHDRLVGEVRSLEADLARANPPAINLPGRIPIDPLAYHPARVNIDWLERIGSLRDHRRWVGTTEATRTVAAAVDSYLERKREGVAAGQVKATTYKPIADRLPHFRAFAGGVSADKIDERTLSGFHAHLLARIGSGDLSPQYAKSLLAEAKSFVRHLWRERTLENLPRNLDGLTIRVEDQEIETFDLDDLGVILDAATERTRLYLLLMLNCGYYQSDIAAIKQAQVDWVSGRITRKRTKTEREKRVPRVSYLLWEETFRLLKKYRSQDPTLALTNENGAALYRRPLRDGGKVGNTDNIKKGYERLCSKLNVEKFRPLMVLRKTSVTLLETHEEFGRYAQNFLGHAPQSLAERKYAKPSGDRFDRAVRWLGLQYGFVTTR